MAKTLRQLAESRRGRLVLLQWRDAAQYDNAAEMQALAPAGKSPLVVCSSSGWAVRRGNSVVIWPNVYEDPFSHEDGAPLCVPDDWIIQLRILEVKNKIQAKALPDETTQD